MLFPWLPRCGAMSLKHLVLCFSSRGLAVPRCKAIRTAAERTAGTGALVHAERLHRVKHAALIAREQFGEKVYIFFRTK